MAQKKKNPYQQAQRQFVQKRAQEKGFEELTVDQREQLRNRFQQLASTQKGRTTIAQKLLSNATPEERKQFKQKLAQNIPSRGNGGLSSTGTQRPPVTTGKTMQVSDAATRNLQRMKPVAKAAAPAAQPKKQDERWGKGFFSVPKSLKGIAKEFGAGAYQATIGALESQSATFLNPAANKALRGVEMAGGLKKGELGRFREARAAEAYTNVAFAALAAPQVGAVGRAGLRIGLDVASGVAGKAGLKNISVGLGIKRAESLGIEAARRSISSAAQAARYNASEIIGPSTGKAKPPVRGTVAATAETVAKPTPTRVKKAPVAKKAPVVKKAPPKPAKPARLTEQQKVDVVRSKEFGQAIEKASGGQLKPVKTAPAKKTPVAKGKPAVKKAPPPKKPPRTRQIDMNVYEDVVDQPAPRSIDFNQQAVEVKPAPKPKKAAPPKVQAAPKGKGAPKQKAAPKPQAVVAEPAKKPVQIKTRPVNQISESKKQFIKSEENKFWTERKRQTAEYTGEVAPKPTTSENYTASIKEAGGFGYSKGEEFEALQGKFPGLTQRKYNIAVTRSKGSGRSLEETVKDMMTPVGENEPGLMRITGEQRIQVKKQQAKAAAKQKRQIAKDVKNLRATKGTWKGI